MKALLSEVLGLKKHLPPSKCPKNDNTVHWGRLMTKLAMVFKWDFACFLCSPDLEFTSFQKQNFPKEMWDKIEGNKRFWAKALFTVDLFPKKYSNSRLWTGGTRRCQTVYLRSAFGFLLCKFTFKNNHRPQLAIPFFTNKARTVTSFYDVSLQYNTKQRMLPVFQPTAEYCVCISVHSRCFVRLLWTK